MGDWLVVSTTQKQAGADGQVSRRGSRHSVKEKKLRKGAGVQGYREKD